MGENIPESRLLQDTGDNFLLIKNLRNTNRSHRGSRLCLSTKDQIVMVNGVSMDNVHSNYTIQILKTCGKSANVVSSDALASAITAAPAAAATV